SLTGIIHAARLRPKFATNFMSTEQFFVDCEAGNLPTYTFIEPQVIGWGHNDMHPPFTQLFESIARDKGIDPGDITVDPPSSILGGEELLSRIYNAVRSSSANGSNHLNTTLLVTFDEHGGTYDHVPPPATVAPDPSAEPGEMGFTFDRAGVRIPTIAVSAWIPEQTVITEEHRATSLLATMRKRWNLGEPLTARDANARPFDDIFTLTTPRNADDWPDITPLPVPPMPDTIFPLDAPLGALGQALLGAVAGYGVEFGIDVPQLDPSRLNGSEAIAAAADILAKLFPLLADS
ncbi:alkaline phosphatase family protein, partial [Ilumatobacter sp.]|uniref:alkaline phosphatase family protein n=1 Tax=Ilumatobacter sp. TaxID=1967498 RepID=UPI003C37128D